MVPKLIHAALAALVLVVASAPAGAQNAARINDQFRGHLSAERYDDAVKTASEHPDAKTRAGMLLAVAKAQVADDLSYAAGQTFEAARDAALTIEDPNERVLILTMSAWIYERVLSGRETPTSTSWPDQTRITLRAARDVLAESDRDAIIAKIEKMPSWSEQITARAGIATVDYVAGEEDAARAAIHGCIEDAATVTSGGRVPLVAWLSWLLACMDDVEGARKGLARASGFAAELDDEKKRSKTSGMVGDLQILCGDPDGARTSFGPVIELHLAMLNRNTERRPFESMAVARIHSKLGDDAKVIEALDLFHELWMTATGGKASGELAALAYEEFDLRVHHGDAATVIAYLEKFHPGVEERTDHLETYIRKTLGLAKEYEPRTHWGLDDTDDWSFGRDPISGTYDREPTATSFRSAFALLDAMPKSGSPFDPAVRTVSEFLSDGSDPRIEPTRRRDTLCSEIVDAALEAGAFDVADQAVSRIVDPSRMGKVLLRIGEKQFAADEDDAARATLDRAIACHTCPDFRQHYAVKDLVDIADVYIERDEMARADAVIELIDAEIRRGGGLSLRLDLPRLARLQNRRGDTVGVLATVRRFARAVAERPDGSKSLVDLADTLDRSGQERGALLCLEQATELASDEDREPLLGTMEFGMIAEGYRSMGKDERALELLMLAKDRACTIASITKRDEMLAELTFTVMWYGDPDSVIAVWGETSGYTPEQRDQTLMQVTYVMLEREPMRFVFDAAEVDVLLSLVDGIEDSGMRAYGYLAAVLAHHKTGDVAAMAEMVDRIRAVPPSETFDPDVSVAVGAGYVNLVLAHVGKEAFEEATAASIAALEVLSGEVTDETDADLSYRATMLLQLAIFEAEHGTPDRLRAVREAADTVVDRIFDDEARQAARTTILEQMPAVGD